MVVWGLRGVARANSRAEEVCGSGSLRAPARTRPGRVSCDARAIRATRALNTDRLHQVLAERALGALRRSGARAAHGLIGCSRFTPVGRATWPSVGRIRRGRIRLGVRVGSPGGCELQLARVRAIRRTQAESPSGSAAPSSERQRKRQASVRYGRHGSASSIIVRASGRASSP